MATAINTTTAMKDAIPEVKIEKFQRNLRCALTEKEVQERAQRAAHLIGERDHKDEEHKAASKQAKAQIAEVDAELRRVSGEVRDGATYREVLCERVHNYRLGQVQEIRADTREVLTERAMTDRERQLELSITQPANDKASNGKRKGGKANGASALPPAEDEDPLIDEVLGTAPPGEVDEEPEEEAAPIEDEYESPLATQKPRKRTTRGKRK